MLNDILLLPPGFGVEIREAVGEKSGSLNREACVRLGAVLMSAVAALAEVVWGKFPSDVALVRRVTNFRVGLTASSKEAVQWDECVAFTSHVRRG